MCFLLHILLRKNDITPFFSVLMVFVRYVSVNIPDIKKTHLPESQPTRRKQRVKSFLYAKKDKNPEKKKEICCKEYDNL